MISDIVVPTIVAGIISFIVALGTTEYRLRREQSEEAKQEVIDWYSDTANIATDIQEIWDQEYERKYEQGGLIKYSEIQRSLKLRSKQINSHIGEGKSIDVDDGLIEEVRELSGLCTSLADVPTGLGDNSQFRDMGREISEKASAVEDEALKLAE